MVAGSLRGTGGATAAGAAGGAGVAGVLGTAEAGALSGVSSIFLAASSSRSESLISSISFIKELVLIKGRVVGFKLLCLSCNKPNLGS